MGFAGADWSNKFHFRFFGYPKDIRLDPSCHAASIANIHFTCANQMATHGTPHIGTSADCLCAVQIALGRNLNIARGLNRPAKTASDLEVLEINIRPASFAGAGSSRAHNFLSGSAFKTGDDFGRIIAEKVAEFLPDSGTVIFSGGCVEMTTRTDLEILTASATVSRLDQGRLELMSATMRALHTDLGYGRLGHRKVLPSQDGSDFRRSGSVFFRRRDPRQCTFVRVDLGFTNESGAFLDDQTRSLQISDQLGA